MSELEFATQMQTRTKKFAVQIVKFFVKLPKTDEARVPGRQLLAAHHLDDYPAALATAIRVGGDCDTNAAIVGGIVASGVGREGIPADWLSAKEPFAI